MLFVIKMEGTICQDEKIMKKNLKILLTLETHQHKREILTT